MGKYIKKFTTHAEYQSYINGGEAILPNVSTCDDQPTHVHYNPTSDWLSVTYEVQTTGEDMVLFDTYNQYGKGVVAMEVDGVMLSTVQNTYRFDTQGYHRVRYKLEDQTSIPNGLFYPYSQNLWIVSADIPSNYTSIGWGAIYTSVDEGYNITVRATVPPTIYGTPFIADKVHIYVPEQSVEAYKTAEGWSDNYSEVIEPIH